MMCSGLTTFEMPAPPLKRGNNSEKHVSTFLWRDDGIELKAHVKRYSTRKHDFQSAEVDFLDSDNDSDNDTNA